MKRFALTFLVSSYALLLLNGCESLSNATATVRERVATREEPRARVFAAEPRATYEAARKAADQMGFRYVRGGPAQGELEALSGVGTSDTMSSSRQISLKVRLSSAAEGGTEVSLVLNELLESDSMRRAGQATISPLRNTPLYEVFFRTVQQMLDASKKG
jgi:hypothetical protein